MERAVAAALWVRMSNSGEIDDPKGHQAASPWQMPRAAWRDIASRTWQRVWDDNVGLVAAGVAFYGFFGLLSLLAMIVLFYGLVADVQTLIGTMQTLTRILPNDVAALIGDQLVQAMKSSEGQKGLGLLIAFFVALYGGTNGAGSIITALNIAYEEKEKRSLLKFYLDRDGDDPGGGRSRRGHACGCDGCDAARCGRAGCFAAVGRGGQGGGLCRPASRHFRRCRDPVSLRSLAGKGAVDVDHARVAVHVGFLAAADRPVRRVGDDGQRL